MAKYKSPKTTAKEKAKQHLYKLHKLARRTGIKLDTRKKNILLPFNASLPESSELKQLITVHGYVIQTQL